jgi:hypothetical protein
MGGDSGCHGDDLLGRRRWLVLDEASPVQLDPSFSQQILCLVQTERRLQSAFGTQEHDGGKQFSGAQQLVDLGTQRRAERVPPGVVRYLPPLSLLRRTIFPTDGIILPHHPDLPHIVLGE